MGALSSFWVALFAGIIYHGPNKHLFPPTRGINDERFIQAITFSGMDALVEALLLGAFVSWVHSVTRIRVFAVGWSYVALKDFFARILLNGIFSIAGWFYLSIPHHDLIGLPSA